MNPGHNRRDQFLLHDDWDRFYPLFSRHFWAFRVLFNLTKRRQAEGSQDLWRMGLRDLSEDEKMLDDVSALAAILGAASI
ncbi:MAG TPA: hypothetical protein DEB46_04465, partial [Myxococcales bacterium]|nr:hypothetical protein [Myxococcales bacterium]